MSAVALRHFVPALRKLEGELAVPIPERVLILRELESDLEALRARFTEAGLAPEDAEARALEALVPDPAALRELDHLHTPLYERLTRPWADSRLRLVERSALALATASVLMVEAFGLLRADLLGDASPFLWPVLLLGALLCAAILATGFGVWVKGDHRAPERGVHVIVSLSVLLVAVAVGGAFTELVRLAATLEASPGRALELVPRWLVRDCVLVSLALLLATMGGLAWFVLTRWLTAIRAAHRDVLGLEDRFPELRR